MRSPDQLTPDELASLRMLWSIWPDEILMRRDRDHGQLDDLVRDDFVVRTDYGELGIGYRIAPVHAAGLARVTAEISGGASRN